MGKMFRIILIVLAGISLILVGCVVLFSVLSRRQESYWQYSQPEGKIETKYTALGTYEVSHAEYDAEGTAWEKYEIYYPSARAEGVTYPLVIMANGTGVKASQYAAVFRHLASWGFIVAGNEDENCRTGEYSAATLDFVLKLNEEEDSPLYGLVDTQNIGIVGHSQGGVGALNAATAQENGGRYKAICTISATSRYHADELNKSGKGWSVDASQIFAPILMVAGTGTFEAGTMEEYSDTLPDGGAQGICPLWWLNECYDAVPTGTDNVMARRSGKDHGDMLHAADGYMTAWFAYYLQGDEEAGKAFFSENAEILSNQVWQDVRTSR